nr:CMRF35-like molecule 1 isoform X7 [Manis javanica]
MKTLDCIRISDKAEVQSENKKDGNCQINFRKLAWLSCQTLTRQQRETPRKAPSGSGASSVIRGPGAVRGPVGGSLTVQCHYDPGWEKYVKWWCRGAAWSSCNILVKTTGSEHKVKMNHVSIEDDQMNRMFTVTLEELRWSDADTYWCGIEKIASDLGVQVKVAVDPVPVTPEETLRSPNMTSHHPDGSCWNISRAAPGGRPLLRKPDPAAARNLLREEGLQKAPRLCPGEPGGSGICHHGSLSQGGHLLCSSVFAHLGSGSNLQQHGLPHHPHFRQGPRRALTIQRHQEVVAWAPGPPLAQPQACDHVPALSTGA